MVGLAVMPDRNFGAQWGANGGRAGNKVEGSKVKEMFLPQSTRSTLRGSGGSWGRTHAIAWVESEWRQSWE
jgi:hypothetical protein